jgi:hypothetical protein
MGQKSSWHMWHVRFIIRGLCCSTRRADWRSRWSFRSSYAPSQWYVCTFTLCVCVFLVRVFFFIFSLCLYEQRDTNTEKIQLNTWFFSHDPGVEFNRVLQSIIESRFKIRVFQSIIVSFLTVNNRLIVFIDTSTFSVPDLQSRTRPSVQSEVDLHTSDRYQ